MTEELHCTKCFHPVARTSDRRVTCTNPACGEWWADKADLDQTLPTASQLQRWKYLRWQLGAGVYGSGPDDGADLYPESVETR